MFIPDSPLYSIFTQRCPRCHTGKLFINPNPYILRDVEKMHDSCPHCKQDFRIEPGFYFGSSYVSYAFVVGLVMFTLVVGYFWLHLPIWVCFASVVTLVVSLAPVLFRLSRTIWIHIFVRYKK